MVRRRASGRPILSPHRMRLVEAIDAEPVAFEGDANKSLWNTSPFFTYFNLSSVEEKKSSGRK